MCYKESVNARTVSIGVEMGEVKINKSCLSETYPRQILVLLTREADFGGYIIK